MLRKSVLVALSAVVVVSSSLHGQKAADPSGHWEGSVLVPDSPVRVEVDLARNAQGVLAGTLSHPAENVKGLPLGGVTVEGRSIKILVKAAANGGTFDGTLSEDGKVISGVYKTTDGMNSIPFTLTRTGEARIEEAPKNAAISKELEGTWNGAITVGAQQNRLVLKLANQPDGTSTATIISLDGSGVEIPIALEQKGNAVTFTVKLNGATYAGTLAAGVITGTWTQGTFSAPLIFKR